MDEVLVSGLSASEAEAFLAVAVRRHPALDVRSRVDQAAVSNGSESLAHQVVIGSDDAARYADVFEALVAAALPLRLRVHREEREIEQLVGDIVAHSRDADVAQLCSHLEHRITPWLLPLGDFVDGFNATSAEVHDRRLELRGRCWLLPKSEDGGPFEARFELDADGTLKCFELRFGDPSLASTVMPRDTPDHDEKDLFGYRTTIRRQTSEDDSGAAFAFEIVKT